MIVADATPLVHLARSNRLALLARLYKRVVVPRYVWVEVAMGTDAARHPESHRLKEAPESWLEVRTVPAKVKRLSQSIRKVARLGGAEADAIALAESLNVPLLVDDAAAVRVARLRGVETRWTTSVVLDARAAGILDRGGARAAIEELVRGGLWIRQDVLLQILELLDRQRP